MINGFNSTGILPTLKRFDLDQVENSLIKIFVEQNKLQAPKNELLKERTERANQKTSEQIAALLEEKKIPLSLKNMERLLELLIEEKDRKINGSFYTPNFVVDEILQETVSEKKTDFSLCDCSCGSGAFLVLAAKRLSKLLEKPITKTIQENIFGVDLSPRSVNRTKIMLSLLALENGENQKEIKFNLAVGNSINPEGFQWKKEFKTVFERGGFDAVVGNPPYVRIQNFDAQTRKIIKKSWLTTQRGNVDLFIPFIELATNLINENGKIGYIVPNSFFHSSAGKDLRKFLQQQRLVKKIIDFNHLQVFKDATTYTAIVFLDKSAKKEFDYCLIHDETLFEKLGSIEMTKIIVNRLNAEKWVLLNENEWQNIARIERAGNPLDQVCKITIGIATLRDHLYLLKNPKEKNGFFVKESNGKEYLIEKGLTKEIIKASIIKDENGIQQNKTRIIFPYKKIGERYRIIPELEFRKNYPKAYAYFLDVKKELSKRDRGKKKYSEWYAFGREQGLRNGNEKKLLTSNINKKPNFVICDKPNTLFYSGVGLYSDENLLFLQKILNSAIMDYYIKRTSKDYSSAYKSYAKSFLKNFALPNFTKAEKELVIRENNPQKIDSFLIKKYGLNLT